MKKITGLGAGLLLAASLAATSQVAQAAEISYSNAEAGYQMLTGDGDFDGFLVRGSFQLNDDFYLAAGFDELKDGGMSQEILSVRGGMRFALENNLDVYGELGLARAKIKVEVQTPFGTMGGSDSETGIQLEGGARMMLSEKLEARAFLRHINASDFDETFLGAQGVFYVADQVGLFAGVSRLFDASEFAIEAGVRFSF